MSILPCEVVVSGLLRRGLLFLQNHNSGQDESLDAFELSGSEGISKEDQQDIIRQIEKVAAENRIMATPQVFAYRALKKGSLFPILINIISLVALAGGLALMAYFFRQTESRITGQNTKITTAEGEILQEVKREAQQQLSQKNQEISSIQTKLQQITSERTQLQSNMESRIQSKEAELRKQLDAELAAERQKLQNQGVSQAEISRRLSDLEAAKTKEFNSQMAQFRKSAETEREKLATNLRQLETEYRANLAQATADRARIQQESDQKISQLQSQYQGQINQSKQELSAAQQRLAALQNENQKEQTAASQITGFYTRVRNDVDENNYAAALATLSNLRDFISADSILQIPAIRQRRPAEIYIINSLTTLINQQSRQNQQDTSSMLAAASIVDQAKSLASQASTLLKQGSEQQAVQTYQKAIALVPGIEASHQYLMDRVTAQVADLEKQLATLKEQQATLVAQNGDLSKQLQTDAAQNQALLRNRQDNLVSREAADARIRNALQQATTLYGAGRYPESLDQYSKALSLLTGQGTGQNTILNQLSDAGYRIRAASTTRAATEQAAPLMKQAQSLVDAGKYPEAVDAFGKVIRTYPMADQVPAAVTGMRSAFSAQVSALQTQISSLTKERDTLATQLSSAGSAGGAQQGTATNGQVAALTTENNKLNDQLKTLKDQIAALQQEKTGLQDRLARAEAAGPVMDAATQKELERLRTVDAAYKALEGNYRSYTAAENAVMGSPPSAAGGPLPPQSTMLKGKVLLDTFLASDRMRSLFPGLLDRIREYDRGFEEAGRSAAISSISDTVYALSQLTTTQERSNYVQQQAAQASNPEMKSFLQDLGQLVTAQ